MAAVVSGAPSTLHAVATGRSPLAAVRAAAALAPAPLRRSRTGDLGAGLVVHAALSLGWAAVLAAVLPRQHTALWGVAAGATIAALDLGIVAERFPAIADLPAGPQVADHLVFGGVCGLVLSLRRGSG